MNRFRLLASLLLAIVSLTAQAQIQGAKGDTLGTTQANRVNQGVSAAGRWGQKGSTGSFDEFALKREVVAASQGGVQSVNSKSPSNGNVTLTSADITEATNLYYTTTRARSAISATGPIVYNSTSGAFTFNGTPADVQLGNVNNTSDVNKPVSTPQQNALDLKANVTQTIYSVEVASYSALSSFTVPNGKKYLITVLSDEQYKKKDGSNGTNTLYWKSVSSDGATTTLYKVTFIDQAN